MSSDWSDSEAEAQRFRLLFEHSIDAIFLTDDQGRYRDVNRAACAMVGYSREELRRMNVDDLSPPAGPRHADIFTAYLEKGHDVNEARFLRGDGKERIAEYAAFRIGPDQNFAVARDITKRRAAERRLLESEQHSRELYSRLQESEARLRLLSGLIIEAQERERRRLARELHDELGGLVNTMTLTLSRVEAQAEGAVATQLAEVLKLSRTLGERTRQISLRLRPPILDDLGLLPALRWHADHLHQTGQLKVDLDHEGPEQRLLPEIETAIYRVVQEALTNVVRHAQIGTAQVRLRIDGQRAAVRITDRGAGFDPAAPRPATAGGLLGMRERAELLGGTLSVESAPTVGTLITAQFPLR